MQLIKSFKLSKKHHLPCYPVRLSLSSSSSFCLRLRFRYKYILYVIYLFTYSSFLSSLASFRPKETVSHYYHYLYLVLRVDIIEVFHLLINSSPPSLSSIFILLLQSRYKAGYIKIRTPGKQQWKKYFAILTESGLRYYKEEPVSYSLALISPYLSLLCFPQSIINIIYISIYIYIVSIYLYLSSNL